MAAESLKKVKILVLGDSGESCWRQPRLHLGPLQLWQIQSGLWGVGRYRVGCGGWACKSRMCTVLTVLVFNIECNWVY